MTSKGLNREIFCYSRVEVDEGFLEGESVWHPSLSRMSEQQVSSAEKSLAAHLIGWKTKTFSVLLKYAVYIKRSTLACRLHQSNAGNSNHAQRFVDKSVSMRQGNRPLPLISSPWKCDNHYTASLSPNPRHMVYRFHV